MAYVHGLALRHVPAASQKALNAEDTDLIEITLTTLFSLDKLLHLLRQRSKTLRLLDARIRYGPLTLRSPLAG